MAVLDAPVLTRILDNRNFKTQTHVLMKNAKVSRNDAIAMIVRFLEPRIADYSSDEILEKLLVKDAVLLYKITYSRKDAERDFFAQRDRTEKIKDKLAPLYEGTYQPFLSKRDQNKVDFVIDNAFSIFTKETAKFVIHLLTYGEGYTKEVYHLDNVAFTQKIKRITRRYIPAHRADINKLIDSYFVKDNLKEHVIKQIVFAYEKDNSDVLIQNVFDSNTKICEELIGECNTPYIHKQRIFIDDYANAPEYDKRSFARFLMKIEKDNGL